MDLSYFKKVHNAYGAKQYKDVILFDLKQQIKNDFDDTIDYEEQAIVNGKSQRLLVVEKWNTELQKTIYAYPNETFQRGDYVEVFNSTWLVTHLDFKQQLIHKGTIEQCNYTLAWKSKTTGEVIHRKCIVENATQYNSGVRDQQVVTIGTGQYKIRLPIDDEVLQLKTNDRLLFGFNSNVPKAYKITLFNDVPLIYEKHGLVEIMTIEDVLNPTRDNYDLMIADYYSENGKPDNPVVPTGSYLTLSGLTDDSLFIGDYPITTLVQSYDHDGKLLSNSEYTWDIQIVGKVKDGWITYKTNGNQTIFTISYRFLLSYLPVSLLVTIKDTKHNITLVKAIEIKSR